MDGFASPELVPVAVAAPSLAPTERPVPSPLGRKLLLFEFVVLVEYFVAPAFLGLTNYAGLWSTIGAVLFVVFATTLVVFVLVPLWPRLREATRPARRRALFHGVWISAFVAGLFLTNLLQFPDDRLAGPLLFGSTTIYTPLGAWPSLTVYVPSIDLFVTLNVEQPAVLLLLAVLSAAAVTLSQVPRCDVASPETGAAGGARRGRFLSWGSLGPLGFVTGCPTCFPAYFALLAWVAPGVAESGYVALPLVPWIGFAGLLTLLGFFLATRSIQLLTSSRSSAPATIEGRA